MLLTLLIGAGAQAARIAAPDAGGLPDAGRLVFELSEGAEVQRMPQVRPRRYEVIVRGNRADLAAQLEGRSVLWLDVGDAWSVGGGTWLMEFETSRADVELEIQREGDTAIFSFAPGRPELRGEPPEPVSVEELLAGVERDAAPRPALALHPLDGDAAYAMLPEDYKPGFPVWGPEELPRGWELELLAAPRGGESWYSIDRYRQVLTETTNTRVDAYTRYRLGMAHLELGFPREAAAYLDQVVEDSGGPYPAALVHLARARAAWTVGRWDVARQRCADAFEAGARRAQVLECLGVVSLATADPPPSQTARALSAATGRPEATLLAAELYQRDHRHLEALPLLERAIDALEDPLQSVALVNLGDARYALGQQEPAREAWRDASGEPDVTRVVALRQRMRKLVEEGVDTWLKTIPDLRLVGRREDRAGAEARYLLVQIAEDFDDLDGAIAELTVLADDYRRYTRGSDVLQRLWESLERRFGQLAAAGEPLRLAALYREHYRHALEPLVGSTDALELVTGAFESLGLFEEALAVQREVFAVHTRQERDQPASLITLARLYVETGRPEEALRTLGYLRGLGGLSPEDRAEALLLEAEIHYEGGRLEQAVGAYRQAEQYAGTRSEASATLALIETEAGYCDRALPRLQDLVRDAEGAEVQEVAEGRVHLALARCLLERGDADAALIAAREGAGRTPDDLSRRYATWVLAQAAAAAGVDGLAAEALTAGDDVWAALGREAREDEALREEIARRR